MADDEIIPELAASAERELNLSLDRGKLNVAITGRLHYRKETPANVLSARMDQIRGFSERVSISVRSDFQIEVKPAFQDFQVFQHLRFGCEWHDPVDIETEVAECLKN